jgi:hypothetical protein
MNGWTKRNEQIHCSIIVGRYPSLLCSAVIVRPTRQYCTIAYCHKVSLFASTREVDLLLGLGACNSAEESDGYTRKFKRTKDILLRTEHMYAILFACLVLPLICKGVILFDGGEATSLLNVEEKDDVDIHSSFTQISSFHQTASLFFFQSISALSLAFLSFFFSLSFIGSLLIIFFYFPR